MKTHLVGWLSLIALGASPALGQFDSGSNESDGVLNCQSLGLGTCEQCTEQTPCEVQISLAAAASLCDCDGGGQLDDPCESSCPSPIQGRGVYDASEWAVVFNYTTIDIPAYVTVTFVIQPKGAPVVWLATGDVTIAGTVELNGAAGTTAEGSSYAMPGPGGFSGGIRRVEGSAGFGPGGGSVAGSYGGGGGYGGPGDRT